MAGLNKWVLILDVTFHVKGEGRAVLVSCLSRVFDAIYI